MVKIFQRMVSPILGIRPRGIAEASLINYEEFR